MSSDQVPGQIDIFGESTPTPQEKLSADRKRTLRQKADIAGGRHPVTKLPLLEHGDHTCGDCGRLFENARGYFKCDANATSGAATDIRKSWPACTLWRSQ